MRSVRIKIFGVALMGALLGGTLLAAVEYKPVADWLKLPEGRPQMGNQHGDVAVSSKGEVYVSVQDPQAGLQVYAPDGKFLRNVPERAAGFPRLRHPQTGGRRVHFRRAPARADDRQDDARRPGRDDDPRVGHSR